MRLDDRAVSCWKAPSLGAASDYLEAWAKGATQAECERHALEGETLRMQAQGAPHGICERCDRAAILPGGNMQAAFCGFHLPCACGAVMVAAGETFQDHGGGLMPGEARKHTRQACTDPLPDPGEWLVIYERETARVFPNEEAARDAERHANEVTDGSIETMAFSVALVAEVMGARR